MPTSAASLSSPQRTSEPASAVDPTSWQVQLRDAVRNQAELERLVPLAGASAGDPVVVEPSFPTLVPRSFLERVNLNDPEDPLLLQVLPLPDENQQTAEFSSDPVGDAAARKAPGLLHKYQGRALLVTTGACAVHCRYCFRRSYPYANEPRKLDDWQPALDAITADSSLREIILSGGDPLMLTDVRLGELVSRLAIIPHLRRLRVHSRMPIVLPGRVTAELIDILTGSHLSPVMVVHANHANEFANDCADALRRLVCAGIPTLNQAVLLRGINDNIDALTELCERSIDLGVMPYYLHQLDRVQGAAHFEVPVERGRELMRELRKRLPGYAVPKYVREVAGEPYKVPL